MSQQKRHYWWKRDHSDTKYKPPQDPFDYEAGERKIVAPYTYVERALKGSRPPGDGEKDKEFESMADTFALGQVRSKNVRNLADRKFGEDFRRWLTKTNSNAAYPGTVGGKYTATQGTRLQKNEFGGFSALPPNFATRPLLQVPGCSDYIDSFVQAQGEFKKKYMPLLAFGPKNLDEAYLYYKYIVVPGFDPSNPHQVQEFLDDYDFYVSQEQANDAGAPGAHTIVPDDREDVRNNQWPYRRNTTRGGSGGGIRRAVSEAFARVADPVEDVVEDITEGVEDILTPDSPPTSSPLRPIRRTEEKGKEPEYEAPVGGRSITFEDEPEDEGYETEETRPTLLQEDEPEEQVFEVQYSEREVEQIRSSLRGQRDECKRQLQELRTEMESVQGTNQTLSSDKQQLMSQLSDYKRVLKDLEDKSEELTRVKASLQTEQGSSRATQTRYGNLEAELAQVKSQCERDLQDLRTQLQTAINEKNTTIGELSEKRRVIQEKQSEIDAAQTRHEEAIRQYDAQIQQYKDLITEKDKVIEEYRAAEQQGALVPQDEFDFEGAMKEIEQQEQIQTLQSALALRDQEIEQSRQTITALQQVINEQQPNQDVSAGLQTTLDRYEIEYAKLKQDYALLQANYNKITEDYARRIQEMQDQMDLQIQRATKKAEQRGESTARADAEREARRNEQGFQFRPVGSTPTALPTTTTRTTPSGGSAIPLGGPSPSPTPTSGGSESTSQVYEEIIGGSTPETTPGGGEEAMDFVDLPSLGPDFAIEGPEQEDYDQITNELNMLIESYDSSFGVDDAVMFDRERFAPDSTLLGDTPSEIRTNLEDELRRDDSAGSVSIREAAGSMLDILDREEYESSKLTSLPNELLTTFRATRNLLPNRLKPTTIDVRDIHQSDFGKYLHSSIKGSARMDSDMVKARMRAKATELVNNMNSEQAMQHMHYLLRIWKTLDKSVHSRRNRVLMYEALKDALREIAG